MELKDYLGSIFGILSILSTLLIFVISWWIVLIINICEILILNIFFREMQATGWLYLVEVVLCIVIMVLVMCFPDKICGGTMQYISDAEFVRQYFGDSFRYATNAELTKRFYTNVGICLVVLICNLILIGLIFIFRIKKVNKIKHNSAESIYFSFYLSVPLSCMGGMIIANCPLYLSASLGLSIAFGVLLTFIKIMGMLCNVGGNSDVGGGRGKTYHVFIVED